MYWENVGELVHVCLAESQSWVPNYVIFPQTVFVIGFRVAGGTA